jgi:hypothetical protein
MRLFLFIVVGILCSELSQAQMQKINTNTDSLARKLSSVKQRASQKSDSMSGRVASKLDSIRGLELSAIQTLDSLNPSQKISSYHIKLDSTQYHFQTRLKKIQKRLQSKSDSLKSLRLPTDKLDGQLKVVQGGLDSLASNEAIVKVQKTSGSINEASKKYETKIEKLENSVGINSERLKSKVGSKLEGLSSINVLGDKLNNSKLPNPQLPTTLQNSSSLAATQLPRINLPVANILGVNTSLPSANMQVPTSATTPPSLGGTPPLMSTGVPTSTGLNIPNLLSSAIPTNAHTISNGSSGLDLENTLPSTKLPDPNFGMEDFQTKAGEVANLPNQAGEYSNELRKVKEGRIDSAQAQKLAEEHFSKMKESKKIKEQTEAIDRYKQMASRYRDPVAMKKELERNAKELAFDKMTTGQTKISEAMANMNKLKKKYGEVKDINKIPTKRYNAMRGNPFVERLVPGVSLQMQGGSNFLLDINPYVGYQFSHRLMVGIGWNERIGVNFSKGRYFINEEHVYGVRSFVQYRIASMLTLRGEIEQMNTTIRQPNIPLDNANRKWVWSYLLGIKQDFRISKKINANAQLLYNLYDPKRESPYADRLLIRVGFEFPQKKKVKETE